MSEAERDALALASFAPARTMRTTFAGIAVLVGPGSLVTGLLYYFGWSRASAQASQLGLQDTLLGFSSKDYLLSSISPMFWPLVVLLLATLGGLLGHSLIVGWAARPQVAAARVARAAIAVVAAGLLGLLFGTFGFDRTTRFYALASPMAVTGGMGLLGYSVYLYHRFVRPAGDASVIPEMRAARALSSVILAVLLLLGVFWSVSHYAAVTGVDLAVRLEDNIRFQPGVAVYSAKRLQLQSPVRETELPGEGAAYRYRYTGLKLLFRSDHRFFLRPSDADRSRVNIVIAEGPDVRLEFFNE